MPGVTVKGPVAPARHRNGRALFAVSLADQPRSGSAGDADLASVVLRDLPRQEGRRVRDARTRGRHLGAERRRHRRRARFCSRPTISIASASRCSSHRSIGCAAAAWSACSTRPIASSTCSGATSIRRIRPAAGASRRRIATPSASSTGITTPWSAASAQQLRAGDVLMVISDHGFTLVSARRQLESMAVARGLPGAQARRRRPQRVASRRGLVRDARVRARIDRHVPQSRGP